MENNITRTRSTMDLAISAAFIIAGAALLFTKSDSLYILGILIILCGVVAILVLKSNYKLMDKKGLFRRKSLHLSNSKKEAIIAYLEGRTDTMTDKTDGNLLLYVYYAPDKSGGYAQLHVYEGYEYRPCTELLELPGKKITELLK